MCLLATSTLNSSIEAAVQNNTDDSHCEKTWINIAVPVYITIITVLGVVFNVFVLMVFCLHKKSCTVAEIYLSNLAAADLILMAFMPFWAVNVYRVYKWPFGQFVCKAVSQGIYMNACCSTFFLVLVSMDRYLALVHTMSQSRLRRRSFAKLCCLLVWGLGFLISLPIFIHRTEVPYCNVTNCYLKYPNDTAEVDYCNATLCYLDYPTDTARCVSEGMLIMFIFIIPIFIISFCTFKILQVLKNRPNRDKQSTEHKATILVLSVVLAFVICWLPYHVARILGLLLSDIPDILKYCFQFSPYFAFFNSVLNPILYVIVGKNFRKRAVELFVGWKRGEAWSRSFTRSYRTRSVKSVDVSG